MSYSTPKNILFQKMLSLNILCRVSSHYSIFYAMFLLIILCRSQYCVNIKWSYGMAKSVLIRRYGNVI